MTRPMRSPRLLGSDSTRLDVAGPVAPHPSGPFPGAAPTRPASGPIPAAPARAPVSGAPSGQTRLTGPTAAADAAAGDPVPRRHPGHPADPSPITPPRQRVPAAPGPELRAVPAPPAPAPPRPAPGPRSERSDAPSDGEESGPWALVRSAQAGDMGAFSELFDRYYDVVFRYVLFRMNDRTLAEDITQETFLRALRRITSVTYQGRDIGAWFVTIARNLIFDHVKSSRYRLESTTSDIVELSPSTHGPEQQVLDLATNEELLRCVRKLNADQQECISLRFLQGLSVAETAKIMGKNEGAIKTLQYRAVRTLAQLLPEGTR
jgi:RNA polymerase sigma-70 factor (ECF subfamily)